MNVSSSALALLVLQQPYMRSEHVLMLYFYTILMLLRAKYVTLTKFVIIQDLIISLVKNSMKILKSMRKN